MDWFPVVGNWNGSKATGMGAVDLQTKEWHLNDTLATGKADHIFRYGGKNCIPVVGDWDGCGKDGIGVVYLDTMEWHLQNTLANTGKPADHIFRYGGKNCIPVVGDWNGDGKDGIGVVYLDTMEWHLQNTLANTGKPADHIFKYGGKNCIPVVGDWDGDGKDGIGVVYLVTMEWHLQNTLANTGKPADHIFKFGAHSIGDFGFPIAGDWDGDKKAGVGYVQMKKMEWHLQKALEQKVTNGDIIFSHGGANRLPVEKWSPATGPSGRKIVKPGDWVTLEETWNQPAKAIFRSPAGADPFRQILASDYGRARIGWQDGQDPRTRLGKNSNLGEGDNRGLI